MIDLVQHHEVIRFEDPHRIFDDERAHAALVEARQAGKLKYIGFTGHKDPWIQLNKIAVLGMKSMANGILLKSKRVTPIECLHYALNLPTSVVITGIDSMQVLDQAFEAARTFRPLSAKEVESYVL